MQAKMIQWAAENYADLMRKRRPSLALADRFGVDPHDIDIDAIMAAAAPIAEKGQPTIADELRAGITPAV